MRLPTSPTLGALILLSLLPASEARKSFFHRGSKRQTNAEVLALGLPPLSPPSFVRHDLQDGSFRMLPSKSNTGERLDSEEEGQELTASRCQPSDPRRRRRRRRRASPTMPGRRVLS